MKYTILEINRLPKVFVAIVSLLLTLGSGWAAEEDSSTKQSKPSSTAPYQPQTRHYYIAAEDLDWNYAPSGKNLLHPGKGMGVWGQQTTYQKTRYVEYTDDSFTEKKPQPKWLGVLGPVVRGVVGDILKIHFLNKASEPYSIHAIGTFYDKANEGAAYGGQSFPGQIVKPGESYAYTLKITPDSGPAVDDPSSILRLYRSHVSPVGDVTRGLVGPIIITRAEAANPDGTPNDVDSEFVAMYTVFDENREGEEEEGHLMHSINGYIFGNLPGLVMDKGERVRWYLFAMGSEVDLHTPHWHGNGVIQNGQRKEVLMLLPTVSLVSDMNASNPGLWMFKCNINDHITAGMSAMYSVRE